MYNTVRNIVTYIDEKIGASHTVSIHTDGSVKIGDDTSYGLITHRENAIGHPFSVEHLEGDAERHPDLQRATCALLIRLYEWKVYAAVYERPKKYA